MIATFGTSNIQFKLYSIIMLYVVDVPLSPIPPKLSRAFLEIDLTYTYLAVHASENLQLITLIPIIVISIRS